MNDQVLISEAWADFDHGTKRIQKAGQNRALFSTNVLAMLWNGVARSCGLSSPSFARRVAFSELVRQSFSI